MPDIFSPEQRHYVMSQIHSSSTKRSCVCVMPFGGWRTQFSASPKRLERTVEN